ncbi:MAG: DUF1576 domain-containing protein [Candidatus Cloacimonadales bacterium]
MQKQNKILLSLFSSIFVAMIALAISADGWQASWQGFLWLQIQPARLLNDFFALAGIGATLLNSVAVGILAVALILFFKIQLSGPTFAAIFTILGFGLFGKTVLNILPIFLGVYFASKVMRISFQEYAIIALFGTAIGPLISFIAFELGFAGLTGIIIGSAAGVVAGFFLPAIAIAMLHMHQGYNLYNIGLTTGFLGLFATGLIRASGLQLPAQMNWFSESSLLLSMIVPVISLILILVGTIFGRRDAWIALWKIQSHSGRLPSDFMQKESMEGALINAGLIGLIGSTYVWLVQGDFNGPVIGGLFTIIGFATFGTHLKNSWSILLGIICSALLFGKALNAPGPILAAIFGTTLAPLAGQFGAVTGFIAGFLHLVMVLQTGSWHGGMSLYNNGFAGGLTATLIVAYIQWYQNRKYNK